jgi:CRP/FNR family cyclic AMP-dependent transcriptional regulator
VVAARSRSRASRDRRFQDRLQHAFRREAAGQAVTCVGRNARLYNAGEPADRVFFVESGRVKLLMLSPAGKECLLGFRTPGHVFGELALSGRGGYRLESAVALEETHLRSLPARRFLACLRCDGLLESFLQYLVDRIARQQQIITHLVTVDSEHRLAETLLMLARTLGRPDPGDTRIDSRISHEELSQMVGTTRPRITEFMKKFRTLGLIDVTRERHLIVRQSKLAAHLASAG